MAWRRFLKDEDDIVPWTGPILSRHARERCKQRHINPLHVGTDPTTRVCEHRKVVKTVWKEPPTELVDGIRQTRRDFHGPVRSGAQDLREKNRAKTIPKQVLPLLVHQALPSPGLRPGEVTRMGQLPHLEYKKAQRLKEKKDLRRARNKEKIDLRRARKKENRDRRRTRKK